MWQKAVMLAFRHIAVPAFLVSCGYALSATADRVIAQVSPVQTAPMEITTDTPEYCHKLLVRISDLVRLAAEPIPREANDLTAEGKAMCDRGQTRGGIMRLRSVLMMLERNEGPAYR